ncbi:hypothetical protein [Nocardia vinacea]|uniref:hypothetical protein n=1 Tax=Nocardia vinacea TaxID=96468 RepID=UPI0002F64234|nr:hypothetical protein [Nocardia vinacea]
MTYILDTDDPDDVTATHGQHFGVVTSHTSQVSATTGAFVLQHSPASALDHRTVKVRDLIVGWFGDAVDDLNDHAGSMHRFVVETNQALRGTDVAGGAQVSGSI